jgi:demethylmacrocin O-methyltransferase
MQPVLEKMSATLVGRVASGSKPIARLPILFTPTLRTLLKTKLTPSHYRYLGKRAESLLGWWYRNDLNRLALLFGTDKWGTHWYTQHYQRYFQPLKRKRLNLLEIGVGGYEHLDVGGESHRMWKAYFRKSRIVGIDIYDKTHLSEDRIDIRQIDQTDSEALIRLSTEYGGFDIIVDDGSHLNQHVIKTFQVLFPLLRQNGIYVVEDTQTAYWPTWGGGIDNPDNAMSFFMKLADGLNHVEYPIEGYEPDYFDRNIVGIAFFHNLIFIQKGSNDEKTSHPKLIERELVAAGAVAIARFPANDSEGVGFDSISAQ